MKWNVRPPLGYEFAHLGESELYGDVGIELLLSGSCLKSERLSFRTARDGGEFQSVIGCGPEKLWGLIPGLRYGPDNSIRRDLDRAGRIPPTEVRGAF